MRQQSSLVPQCLSQIIAGQPIDLQRRIHTAVIRAVGRGELRGLKLADKIALPHRDGGRMVKKSDVAFAAADVPMALSFIEKVAREYQVSSKPSRQRLKFVDFLKLSPSELESMLEHQRAADEQMRAYRQLADCLRIDT